MASPLINPADDLNPESEATPAPDPKDLGISDDIKKALQDLVQEFAKSEEGARTLVLKDCKLHELFWRGIQDVFWNGSAGDWSTVTGVVSQINDIDLDPAIRAKVINVFKAYGESIVAAISSEIPSTRFTPKDADDPLDILTAKTFTTGSKLVQDHNDAKILLLRIFYTLWNQHYVALYNYHEKNGDKYGTVDTPVYALQNQYNKTDFCQECAAPVNSQTSPTPFLAADPMASSPAPEMGLESPQMPQDAMMGGMEGVSPMMPPEMPPAPTCPACNGSSPLVSEYTESQIPSQIDSVTQDKGQECIVVYGPLNVKIPIHAASQEEIPYLILDREIHVSKARSLYPEFAKEITPGNYGDYGNWARALFEYGGLDTVKSQVTSRQVWIRNWAFYTIEKEEVRDELLAMFPKGVYLTFMNHELVDVEEESLDDHWTLSIDPTSPFIHSTPRGAALVPLQIMTNEIFNLTAETIQQGIPQNFVDSRAIDFDKFKQVQNSPGAIFPIKSRPGEAIGNLFHTLKTSALSQEVGPFQTSLEQMSQFVSGAFPSIFGGPADAGSNTAYEYKSSRDQALQRLSIMYRVVTNLWTNCIEKSTKSYMNNLISDEKLVQPAGSGFENIWVRRSEMLGKVGKCIPETSEKFPMSWEQKRGTLLELLQLQNESINTAIFHPENTDFVARLLGFTELYIPGQDDRNKQLLEIQEMLKSGQPIQPDPTDNAQFHIEAITAWANSDAGIDTKMSNPQGYQAVMIHVQMHQMSLAPPAPPVQQGSTPKPPAPNPLNNSGSEPPPVG